jgi:hypothetical protein
MRSITIEEIVKHYRRAVERKKRRERKREKKVK